MRAIYRFFLTHWIEAILAVALSSSTSGCVGEKETQPSVPTSQREEAAQKTPDMEPVPIRERGRFEVAGIDNDADVLTFYNSLIEALKKGDKEAVAEKIHYPLFVSSNSRHRSIKSKDTFIKDYDQIIDEPTKATILCTEYSELWANWQGVAFDKGVLWISGVLKKPEREYTEEQIRHDPSIWHLKIVTINMASEIQGCP